MSLRSFRTTLFDQGKSVLLLQKDGQLQSGLIEGTQAMTNLVDPELKNATIIDASLSAGVAPQLIWQRLNQSKEFRYRPKQEKV